MQGGFETRPYQISIVRDHRRLSKLVARMSEAISGFFRIAQSRISLRSCGLRVGWTREAANAERDCKPTAGDGRE